jgi:hypothetical protein
VKGIDSAARVSCQEATVSNAVCEGIKHRSEIKAFSEATTASVGSVKSRARACVCVVLCCVVLCCVCVGGGGGGGGKNSPPPTRKPPHVTL